MIPWWTLPIAVVLTMFLTVLTLALCQASAQNDPSKRLW